MLCINKSLTIESSYKTEKEGGKNINVKMKWIYDYLLLYYKFVDFVDSFNLLLFYRFSHFCCCFQLKFYYLSDSIYCQCHKLLFSSFFFLLLSEILCVLNQIFITNVWICYNYVWIDCDHHSTLKMNQWRLHLPTAYIHW